jgi:general secretion pathway protein H
MMEPGLGIGDWGFGKAQTPTRRRFFQSPIPNPQSRPSTGFTLIELLVVLVIAAVLAAALVVAVAGSSERRLANAAEQFGALLGQACSEAELTGREIGLSVAADGYAFSRLDADAWRAFGRDGALRARAWPAGLRFELSRAGRPLQLATAGHDAPQIVCFSSGELTPFALELSLGDAPAYRVEGTDDGRVETRRAEARR